MDPRERANPYEESFAVALDGLQSRLWTSLPGIVESFNLAALTCVVQPAIQARVLKSDGSRELVNLPLLLDCPVVFPSGGGVTLSFPLKAGDECLVTFSSRCIDSWWQNGGVQPPATLRMQDLSDGFAIPGPRSLARPIAGVSATVARLHTDTGTTFLEIDPADGGRLKLLSPNPIILDAPTVIATGDMLVNGDLDVMGETFLADRLTVNANVDVANVVTAGAMVVTPVLEVGAITIGGKFGTGKLTVDELTVNDATSLTGPVTIKGAVGVDGNVATTGTVIADGIVRSLDDVQVSTIVSLKEHSHVAAGQKHDQPPVTGVPFYP